MEKNNVKKSPSQRLLDLIELEKRDIYLLVLLTVGYGVLGIATPIAVQALVNIVTMGGLLQPLIVVSLILFVLLVLFGALYVFEGYVVELIQRRVFVRATINIAKNGQGLDRSVYDYSDPVELMNRFFSISSVQKSAAILLTVGLVAFLQGVIGSVVLIFYHLYFSILVFVMLFFLAFIVFVLARKGIEKAVDESTVKYETAAWLETIAGNYNVFKFYNGQNRADWFSNNLANQYINIRRQYFNILLAQNIGAVTLYAVIGTLMLALGGGLVIKGQINLGQFVAAELIIFGVLAAIVRFVNKLEYFYDMLAALDKIGYLDDMPQEKIGTYNIPAEGLRYIEVFNVSFNFSPRLRLIDRVSFNLARGKSIAIFGESGAGKTTLLAILTGLRQPKIGRIEFDGNDVRQLNQNLLRNVIGIASRVEVIDGTIIENIVLDRKDIPLNNVNLILGELGLLDDFSCLEDGLETQLTAFGAPLSTTQLQRLMLARAIVGNPNLLIIDGLLDNLTEQELNSVLRLLKAHHAYWMLIVATRFEHIAHQFDHAISLTQQNSEKT
ncbi:MAG: ATP-binding cassette domain-containing protein [Methylotenera sp.]|nr:ATP-binding cassette domain-containing protein [Methylotenera sp.]MDP1755686.1 ATP-binding cassette domain-containing protein [Methylotenera sp.]MDP1960078.1 ATP-binding cassette domain-containing protein [Methylotenera sp.]MDP3206573.1 ATP-binding cassette domain-containing protein [Methylotenera sp.]MDP3304438.1 ATP-binding cassette domain-containing protein [Methylotenera sp.]